MGAELATWRPLFEFSMILVVLGLAGCLNSRDRISWWLSQGLILLGLILGLAATGAMHPQVDLFSLGIWLPFVVVLELIVCVASSVPLRVRRSVTRSVSEGEGFTAR